MLRVNLLACVLIGFVPTSMTHADWYSGDPYSDPTAWPQYTDNESDANGVLALTYDNFNWVPGAGGGIVDVVGGHFHSFNSTPATGIDTAYWEIRAAMSHGSGGSLLFSGTVTGAAVSPYATSFTQGGSAVWGVEVDIPNFFLPAGNYWFGLAIGSTQPGAFGFFVASTYGANGIGAPIGDGVSIYHQTFNFGNPTSWNFTDSSTIVPGGVGVDPSYWINEVPSPAAIALLAIAGAATRRRRNT